MRVILSILVLIVICLGIVSSLHRIPFGNPETKIGKYCINKGREETGAANIVTSVVVNYRGFDTLGEVTILFLAAIGLGSILTSMSKWSQRKTEPASLILKTGCRFLLPLILLFGAYIFIHGHLSPGGGFQGGAIIASAFLLIYLTFHGKGMNETGSKVTESSSGLIFILLGLIGLAVGNHYFLSNFLPKGQLNDLFSAGIIPLIYIAIGLKVGSELAKVIYNLMEKS